jgi:hypothetical protein
MREEGDGLVPSLVRHARAARTSVNHAVRIGTYLNFQIDIGMY